ncbi:MAG: Type IV pilus assembly protein PilM [Parcubacteria group bacterium GW2011_GWA2_47_7]|nr:MAG: Type IV pilus assembly protein PilM [Parcubacteria group bacterium GW2011_GWA2_47_7]
MSLLAAPKFLSMPAVGLDISADSIRFIELTPNRHGHLEVMRYASRNFPIGIISEGHIRDKKKLQDTIASIVHEYKLTFANISLPEEQAYLANIQIPNVPLSAVHDALELRLEEYVPISGVDAVFDFVVVGSDVKHKETLDVVVSVLPRMVVEEYLDIFSGTGLIPKAFEFESQAMARAIVPRGDNGTFLVVDIGKMVTDIFVTANGVVQFSASLDIGGHYITQAIERSLKIPYEEAEALKVLHGMVGGGDAVEVRTAITPVMLDLRTRIMRHFSYWQTHHGEKVGGNIECVYITGGGVNLRGITEYLGLELNVKVVVANSWVNVCSFENYVPPILAHESHGYTAAIGLALRNSFPE